MSSSPRLGLPFLNAGQAQKEIFHNEALQALDVLVAAAVEELPRAAPPASPVVGTCYIVAAAATGEWAGKSQSVAALTSAGWRFTAPQEGMVCYVRSAGLWAAYREGTWEIGQVRGSSLVLAGQQVVGTRLPPIAGASGGTVVDGEARAAIDQILTAMRQHGLIAP
jgi:Protein of unknown function (DUF2793)